MVLAGASLGDLECGGETLRKRHGGGDRQDFMHFADSQHQLPTCLLSLRASWLLRGED